MRHIKFTPSYTNWKNVPGTTIPGRCYSVAELLARTIRNQPLPIMNIYEEKDDGRNSDKDIDEDMEKASRHPLFDRDSDMVEMKEFVDKVDEKLKTDENA